MMVRSYDMMIDTEGLPSLSVSNISEYKGKMPSDPKGFVDLLIACFNADRLAEEHAWLLALNCKGKLIAISDVSHGGYCQSLIDLRPIFTRALILGASHIIIAHNHPSGDPDPSKEDYKTAERLVEAGALLDVGLIDFLIIGKDSYCSFNDKNYIHNRRG